MAEKKHKLVPMHKKLSEKERNEVLKRYNITIKELPKILSSDPALEGMDAHEGDIIKVQRKSSTAGDISYYRGVIRG